MRRPEKSELAELLQTESDQLESQAAHYINLMRTENIDKTFLCHLLNNYSRRKKLGVRCEIPWSIGRIIQIGVEKVLASNSWRNYTAAWKDEMRGKALEFCVKYIHSFDSVSLFTAQIAKYAYIEANPTVKATLDQLNRGEKIKALKGKSKIDIDTMPIEEKNTITAFMLDCSINKDSVKTVTEIIKEKFGVQEPKPVKNVPDANAAEKEAVKKENANITQAFSAEIAKLFSQNRKEILTELPEIIVSIVSDAVKTELDKAHVKGKQSFDAATLAVLDESISNLKLFDPFNYIHTIVTNANRQTLKRLKMEHEAAPTIKLLDEVNYDAPDQSYDIDANLI